MSQPDSKWQIESWTVDPEEAERRARQLVTKPYFQHAASWGEVGGFAHTGPILFGEKPLHPEKENL